MLLDSLVERNEDLKRQLEREIDVYDDLARQEAQGFSQAFANATARRKKDPNANIGTELAKEKHEVSAEVDWKHWSKFLLYRKQAVTLGYRFQADRLRSVEIPKAEARLADHAREANAFREHWPNLLQDLGYKKDKDFKWNWKLRADDAGLDQEHDFLYSYVSRLLHAKPSSLSSVPNDLTVDEVLIFQAYTVLRMRVVSNQIEEFVAKQVPH